MQKAPLDFMTQALKLAEQGRLTVSPNPMVGCVIVKNDQIIGQGFHRYAGHAHAEILALREAGDQSRDATVYTSLEPCCHQNRTPPCTDALIRAGIKKIVIASIDPNPKVAGKGIEQLRAAGIDVEIGLCEQEATQLNEIFFHYIRHRRPFVFAKWAMSLDGKTITQPNDSKSISSPVSRRTTHVTRQQVDAILVGAQTAIDDDPLLTVRLDSSDQIQKHPIRIVLSSRGNLPLDLKMFDPTLPSKTIVATTHSADTKWCESLQAKNIEIIFLPENKQGQVDLPALLDELGKREIISLLVEGGMTIHNSFFQAGLVNKLHVYLAPVIIGTLEKKQTVTNVHLTQLDRDLYLTANYEVPSCSQE